MSVEQISENFWFVFPAYIAAFLPWAVLSAKDFIGPRWKTVKNTRIAGKYNAILSVIPACYIIAYVIVQGISLDYKEMCAALVALLFSALNFTRTLWGLWQLSCFRQWAMDSIIALEAMGVQQQRGVRPHQFISGSIDSSTDAGSAADCLLVNETIIDNQLVHGETRCYVKYGNLALKGGEDGDTPVVRYLGGFCQVFKIGFRCMVDGVRAVSGLDRREKIELKPFEPVNVWLNWSVALAAQCLGQWMSEFSVPKDPRGEADYGDMTARERLDKRGEYFGLELVSSAWLQLWPEVGLTEWGSSGSPFQWGDVWDKKSGMSDGRIVKQELLQKAIESGNGLPFGAAHVVVDGKNGKRLGYHEYRRKVERIVSDLPVQKEFEVMIEKFDIEKLEWLTILVYLGQTARSVQEKLRKTKGERSETVTVTTRNSEDDSDEEEIEISQALRNLETQVNVRDYCSYGINSDENSSRGSELFQWGSIKVPKKLRTFLSDSNRHVSKVGEMIDVWMSLVGGDQISPMMDVNGSGLWEKICCCEGARSTNEDNCRNYSEESSEIVQTNHSIVEKRRLYYNFGNGEDRYESLDHFVTFMGYGMEAVRSRLGEWVRRNRNEDVKVSGEENEGDVGEEEDLFRPRVESEKTVKMRLGDELAQVLHCDVAGCGVDERGVQTRLLWEVQQGLMKEENGGPGCVSTVMLCILSFPSVYVEVEEVEKKEKQDCVSCAAGRRSVFVEFLGCVEGRSSGEGESGGKVEMPDIRICARGGPQEIEVVGHFVQKEGELWVEMCLRRGEDVERFEWVLWRDAFLGRLKGVKEWQEEHEIESTELYLTSGDMKAEVVGISTDTGEKGICWGGWKPFRFGFMRFELESEGVLREQCKGEQVNPYYTNLTDAPRSGSAITQEENNGVVSSFRLTVDSNVSIGAFYRMQVKSVGYKEASAVVLRHGYLLLEEAFLREEGLIAGDPRLQGRREISGRNLIEVAEKCVEVGEDWERALLLFEIAAVSHGSERALNRCIEILESKIGNGRMTGSRMVSVLERFVAHLLPSGKSEGFQLVDGDVEKVRESVLPNCLKVMKRFGDDGMVRDRLEQLLEALWLMDSGTFAKEALAALQTMYYMTRYGGVLLTQARHLRYDGVSGPFNATLQSNMEKVERLGAGTSGRVMVELRKEIWEVCKMFCRKVLNETSGRERYWAFMELAELLKRYGAGNAAENREAVALYRKMIECGESDIATVAMNNLAMFLVHGPEGVTKNVKEAEGLYRRAIEAGHVSAMYNLAMLLHDGTEGVTKIVNEAERLYRRAIEGGDVSSMNGLALLLKDGAEGVTKNVKEAEELYRCAIEAGHVSAMNNLALVLVHGAEGVTKNAREAEGLYRRAIEGGDVEAMYNLASLLEDGAEGVTKNVKEAEELYRRAIDGGKLIAMYNLARVLNRSEGVAKHAREANRLYEQAVDILKHVPSMYYLAILLEEGAEGVDVDVGRAMKLYEDAGTYKDAQERLSALRERIAGDGEEE